MSAIYKGDVLTPAKENMIQLFEYKDSYVGLQALQHAKNGRSSYTI